MEKMKKILFVLLAVAFLLTSCAEMDVGLAGNNRFSFEGATCSIEQAVVLHAHCLIL
jgi:PBP1b-binding outer membrane lipoprotein LpoB